jgi:hypothetical protein
MKNTIAQHGWNSLRMGKFLIFSFCIITLIITGFSSCTDKEEIADFDVQSNLPLTVRSPSTTSDRVYFADINEFKSYYFELDSMMRTYDADYVDSIVDVTTAVQTLNDEVMFSSVGTLSHVSDQVMRAIVNPNGEFEIDGILITYVNDAQWLLSDVSNGTLKTAIRGMTKGALFDTGDIPTGAQWVEPRDLQEALEKFWCGCRVYIEQLSCDEIRVHGACSGFFGANGIGDIVVDFDPNGPTGPTNLIDEQVQNNFEFIINISSFHNMAGMITATGDSPCILETSPWTTQYWFDPSEFVGCDKEHRELKQTITNTAGTERMLIRTAYITGTFADVHTAEITSESWNGSKWGKSNAVLTASVDANRRDGVCDLLDTKSDSETRTKKHVITRVSWGSNCWHCDGDLIGDFIKVKNGTLAETQTVDFHCCQ